MTSNDAAEALNAIRSGVADCLVRDDMTGASVERLICAVAEQERIFAQQCERDLRYLALLDNADELILTHDLDGRFTSLNLAGQQLLDYPQDEWLGLRVPDVVGPEYRADVERMIQLTLDSRQQTLGAIDLITRHGKTISLEVRTHLIYQHGRVVEIQWSARDTSIASPTPLRRKSQPRGPFPSNSLSPNERTIFIA